MGSADVIAGDTILASQQGDLRDDVIDQFTSADEIFVGTGVDAGVVQTAVTQAQAEAGTDTTVRGFTALRVKQAIDALAPAQATQAALEAETNENTYAPPDLIRHSPGVNKAYGSASAGGALQANSYNVVSVGKGSAGTYNWTIDDDMGNANYSPIPNQEDNNYIIRCANIAAGTFSSFVRDLSEVGQDSANNFIIAGDQV